MPIGRMRTIIVQRQTVDWTSRDYANKGSAENFAAATTGHGDMARRNNVTSRVLGLIEFWNATFEIDFATCRQKLKQIAHDSWRNVEQCDEICYEFDDAGLGSRFLGKPVVALFTDDDDWYAPQLFSNLDINDDDSVQAWLWRRTKFDGEVFSSEIGDPVYAFTNNYAFNGTYFPRNTEIKDIMQHGYADNLFARRLIKFACFHDRFLSVTNKSPCSHNMLLQAKNSERPVESLLAKVEKYARTPLQLPPGLSWARPYCQEAQQFFGNVLASRRNR